MAAEDGELAVEDDTLTADVEAGGAARIGEVHCRRDVATAEGVEAKRAADGGAEAGAISLLTDALVEVVDLNVIVDLRARREAEAELEGRGEVDLDAVLVDLHVGVLVDLLLLAEEARAGVEDTLDAEAGLHLLAKLSAIDDADGIGVLSVEVLTSGGVAVGHL